MVQFFEENPGMIMLFLSLAITSVIATIILLANKHVKPKSRRIIEQAKSIGYVRQGILLKSKYHPSHSYEDSHGRMKYTQEYWGALYKFEYKGSFRMQKFKFREAPPDWVNLYYSPFAPKKMYAEESLYDELGARYMLPKTSIFFVWLIVLLILYCFGFHT